MQEFEESIDPEIIRAKINAETAKIPWKNLQRFFAAGKTLIVGKDLDLVDVALAFEQDDSSAVGEWVDSEKITAVSTDQAKQWVAEDSTVWAVVVKPWVLIQGSD